MNWNWLPWAPRHSPSLVSALVEADNEYRSVLDSEIRTGEPIQRDVIDSIRDLTNDRAFGHDLERETLEQQIRDMTRLEQETRAYLAEQELTEEQSLRLARNAWDGEPGGFEEAYGLVPETEEDTTEEIERGILDNLEESFDNIEYHISSEASALIKYMFLKINTLAEANKKLENELHTLNERFDSVDYYKG